MTADLLNKFMHTAKEITDTELKELYAYFKALDKALSVCPSEYDLVRRDVWSKLDRLNFWKDARRESKKLDIMMGLDK